eukprot:TRINITY_DN8958_c0_g1_i1.p1 TRINITY_DN8958_c0_g1~~TRINITY_DN8958_c0_g1_i1.p1  ORF type:complete len:766 (+),score=185.10 TRINITY_DN8958_c0_g1_i1:50-2299(+)
MKVADVLQAEMVPEWRGKYITYKQLKKLIKQTKLSALEIASQAGASGTSVVIDLPELERRTGFFRVLADNVRLVNEFYKTQLDSFIDQFHALISRAIELGLIGGYKPMESKYTTRLQREVLRINAEAKFKLEDSFAYRLNESGSYPLHNSISFDLSDNLPPSSLDGRSDSAPDRLHAALAQQVEARTAQVVMVNNEPVTDRRGLKDAFSEFYRGLVLLEGYCELNLRAIEKILKKHDKNIPNPKKAKFIQKRVEPLEFFRHSELTVLASECEYQYSVLFTGGHRSEAMEKLRVPKTRRAVGLANFRFGFYLGLIVALLSTTIYLWNLAGNNEDNSEPSLEEREKVFPRFESAIIVYRMLGMTVLMLWAWGFDMMIWTRFRINYGFIFQFDRRRTVRYQQVLEGAALFSLLWFLSVFVYALSAVRPWGFSWLANFPWEANTLFLVLMFVGVLFVYQFQSNWWLFNTLFSIVIAPFRSVQFRDFFMADQLLSILIVLLDIEYTICFFAYDVWTDSDACMAANPYARPIIVLLPNWWRFMQCFRRYRDGGDKWQLWNAGKYSTSFFVAVFSALRFSFGDEIWLTLWVVSIFVSTIYTYWWDVYRDWGLGSFKDGFLRKQRLYPTAMYYVALVTNLMMRFMWTLTISPGQLALYMDPLLKATLLAAVEIIRRAQWNLFRLEAEQLSNIGKFRAIDIDVPSVDHYGDQRPVIHQEPAAKIPQDVSIEFEGEEDAENVPLTVFHHEPSGDTRELE